MMEQILSTLVTTLVQFYKLNDFHSPNCRKSASTRSWQICDNPHIFDNIYDKSTLTVHGFVLSLSPFCRDISCVAIDWGKRKLFLRYFMTINYWKLWKGRDVVELSMCMLFYMDFLIVICCRRKFSVKIRLCLSVYLCVGMH